MLLIFVVFFSISGDLHFVTVFDLKYLNFHLFLLFIVPKGKRMILPGVNLEKELSRVQRSVTENLIEEANALLERERKHEERIWRALGKSAPVSTFDALDISHLNADKLYSLEAIRKIAIRYRLRFLPTKYYSGEYPVEAVSAIKELEKAHQTNLENLYIMAPKKKFVLGDCDGDPLLFARVGEDQYYLIAKWGQDLHPVRRVLLWAYQTPGHALFTALLATVILTFLIPAEWMQFANFKDVWAVRGMVFIHILVGILSMGIFFTMMYFRNFSDREWNSKYFNG